MIKKSFPEIVNGYELDPLGKWFSVIVPEETENLVCNPSPRYSTAGYSGINAVISRNPLIQRRSTHSIAVTPNSETIECGVSYDLPVSPFEQTCTFSVDVLAEAGTKMRLETRNELGVSSRSLEFTGTGHWQRIHMVSRGFNVATVGVYRKQGQPNNVFHVDGFQVEEKAYPTTYCDGEMNGFVVNHKVYGWAGTPYNSKSWRSSQTRSGGRLVNLRDLGFYITAIVGLGMSNIENLYTELSDGTNFFQTTNEVSREFTLVGTVFGKNMQNLMNTRMSLIELFRQDSTAYDQPLVLRYQAHDKNGRPIGEIVDIKCLYKSGMEGSIDNFYQEKIALTFEMPEPDIIRDGYTSYDLLYKNEFTASRIVVRDKDGNWSSISPGPNGPVYDVVRKDGVLYFCGDFTQFNGVSVNRVGSFDGTTVTQLGDGLNAAVEQLVFDPDGQLYISGEFTENGSGSTVLSSKIAKLNTATNKWEVVGDGPALGTINPNTLYAGPDGKIYFVNVPGGSDAGVYMFDGLNWSQMGDLIVPYDIAINRSNEIYTSDLFGHKIYRWNESTGTWELLMDNTNNFLYLFVDSIGDLYGSDLIHGNGSFVLRKYDGIRLERVLGGSTKNRERRGVYSFAEDSKGNIYFCGVFEYIDNIEVLESIVVYNRSTWSSIDIDLPGVNSVHSIDIDENDIITLALEDTGAATSSYVNEIYNEGATSSPIIYIEGPGRLHQITNRNTGKSLFFDRMYIAKGEKLTLDFSDQQPKMVSSFRGNIENYLSQASDISMSLISGINKISVLIVNGTADTKCYMMWKQNYTSIEDTLYE